MDETRTVNILNPISSQQWEWWVFLFAPGAMPSSP